MCKSTEPSKSLKNSEKLSKNHSKSLKNVVMTSKSLKKYCCKYCNKSYTRIDNLHRHINKFCKHKIDQINKLEKQIKDLQNNQTYNTTIINQVHNNNTYIKINSFGDEDTSSISDQDMYKIVDRCYSALKTLAERTHISIPENHNIYLPGYKDNYAMIYKGRNWIYNDLKLVLQDLKDRILDIISNYYENNMTKYPVYRQAYINKMINDLF